MDDHLREVLERLVTYAREGDEFADPAGDPDRYAALKAAERALWGEHDPHEPTNPQPKPPRWAVFEAPEHLPGEQLRVSGWMDRDEAEDVLTSLLESGEGGDFCLVSDRALRPPEGGETP